MIPKIIHYCWFGNSELPEMAKECLGTWEKHFPGYQVIQWNEQNFDLSCNQYVREAYEAKKWAFVADYVRPFVLYKYGGIYMDTDVAVIQNFEKFMQDDVFLCFEDNEKISIGTVGAIAQHPWFKDIMDYYEVKSFYNSDGSFDYTTSLEIITPLAVKNGLSLTGEYQILDNGIVVYPREVFIAYDWKKKQPRITKNTYAVHEYAGSWLPEKSMERKKKKKKKIKKIWDFFLR